MNKQGWNMNNQMTEYDKARMKYEWTNDRLWLNKDEVWKNKWQNMAKQGWSTNNQMTEYDKVRMKYE